MSQEQEKKPEPTSISVKFLSDTQRYKYLAWTSSIIAIIVTLVLAVVLASSRNTPTDPVDNNPAETEALRQKEAWRDQELLQILLDANELDLSAYTPEYLEERNINEELHNSALFLDYDNDGQLELIASYESGGTAGIIAFYVFEWQNGKGVFAQDIEAYKGMPAIENNTFVNTSLYYEAWDPNCCASRIYKDTYSYKDQKLSVSSRELQSVIEEDAQGYMEVESDLATDRDYVDVCNRYVWRDAKLFGDTDIIKRSEKSICPVIFSFGSLRFDYSDVGPHTEDAKNEFTVNASAKDEFKCGQYQYFSLNYITCYWNHEDETIGSVTLQIDSNMEFTQAKQQISALLRSIKSY